MCFLSRGLMLAFEEGGRGGGSHAFLRGKKHPLSGRAGASCGGTAKANPQNKNGNTLSRRLLSRSTTSHPERAQPTSYPRWTLELLRLASAITLPTREQERRAVKRYKVSTPTPARSLAVASPFPPSAHCVRRRGGRGRDRSTTTFYDEKADCTESRVSFLWRRKTVCPPPPPRILGASAATAIHGRRRDGVHHHEGVAVGLRGASPASASFRDKSELGILTT